MCEAGIALICCPIFGYLVDVSNRRQSPYLAGLVLLGASMTLLTLAHTVWLFVLARLLQGGATAMVSVAGLALMTDSVEFGNLGQTIGYLGSAITLGFLLGPLLGGLVYNVAGYNAVFGMAFAFIAVDMVMRVFVIEKKVARRWIDSDQPRRDGERGSDRQRSLSGYHSFPEAPTENLSSDEEETASFAILEIARQPRVLISLWGLMVQGLLYSAFDAVCHSPHSVGRAIKLTSIDNPHLRRRDLRLVAFPSGIDLFTIWHHGPFGATLRYFFALPHTPPLSASPD